MSAQVIAETVLGFTDLQLKFATATGQLALAATVAYVAWQQWRTARNKLKSDLFERRFQLVKELRRRVDRIAAGSAKEEEIFTLPDLAREAGFLFNKRIKNISERLVDALKKLNIQQDILKKSRQERLLKINALQEAKARSPDQKSMEIEAAIMALKESFSDLAKTSARFDEAWTTVTKELKKLEEATANFLTLRH
ncbi:MULTISPECIES: hypothetical protein [Xanthomonas]|uniref:hypothetical protein n=1 Tax=Xanthomonas TaxID=338 RepID=UPI001ADD06A6|nr:MULTISPECIES: hypothetical protein [unclassified Xanthomonas]MBO9873952.1 hypothetical protein [Xanthomonas sp. D-93]WNH43834.1 hypothetical protein PG878_15080 [Xanthomonas sp. A6251]